MNTILSAVLPSIRPGGIAIRSISRWLALAALIGWTALLFGFSSQSYSSQTIQPWLKSVIAKDRLAQVVPKISVTYDQAVIDAKEEPFRFVEFLFRKSAHLFVYAVLGGLAFITFLSWLHRKSHVWGISFVYIAIVSSLDEWNQSYTSMRTSTWQDVGVDCIGGWIGMTAASIMTVLMLKQGSPWRWPSRGS
ncbi:VanZ family protein [Paenibacillus mendelii]|uniref:VanZ family protein n=1 Tax=Paenibacillus mendelii TaxID=206163 RepID=A0ABV6J4R9_9BACL|nr:VanZ family protein [Paenibacillus mendelii]MCQ6560427.1 VanZ family protein [Paenibacillus mendelii]